MARKSRKNLDTTVKAEQSTKLYKAGIYARISVDEGGNQSSIGTQIAIAQEFIKNDFYIEHIKTYTDVGYSSYAQIRPAYNDMMKDAETGVINCIIVKDLSRLGRNYMETGSLLEIILPNLGVRFISIAERYDSEAIGYRTALEIPLRSLINHSYSADISSKVKSIFKMKIKNGMYISAYAPLGYRKVKTNQGIFYEINDNTAEYIRTIFNLALSGMTIYQITKKLNNDSNNRIWTQRYVGRILRNSFYIGTYIAGKTDSFFLLKETNKLPKEEWTIIENHHPAIIDKGTFELVGELISQNSTGIVHKKKSNTKSSILNGSLCCEDCGRALKRVRRSLKNGNIYYYFCPTYSETVGGRCSHHSIREDRLKTEIWRQINLEINRAQKYKDKQLIFENSIVHMLWHQDRLLRLEKLKKDLAEFSNTDTKMSFFESLNSANGYSKSDFKFVMLHWKNNAEAVQCALQEIEDALEEYANERSSDCIWVKEFLKWQNIGEFCDNAINKLVDKVVLYQDGLQMRFKFGNIENLENRNIYQNL